MMSNRLWFQIIRFYLLVALRGDPVERKPKARRAPKARPAPIDQLKPLAHTE
jgi:hypothetical protein